MFDSQDEDELSLGDALEQLMEFQREIDAIARQTVEGVKKMISAAPEQLEPGSITAVAAEHGAWYDAIERDLSAAGFEILGPWRVANADELASAAEMPIGQSFYEFALGGDGTIAANWFIVPAEEPLRCVVLETWLEDGSKCDTLAGAIDLGLPRPSWHHVVMLPAGTEVRDLIERHRAEVARRGSAPRTVADMEEILQRRRAEVERLAADRAEMGLALFEPVLRHNYGENYDELGVPVLESIMEHPEWWTGEEPDDTEHASDDGAAAERPFNLVFLMSRDDDTGRARITTLGMMFHGLPELQMPDLAANHCRSARFLMLVAGRKLVEHAKTLSPDDDWEEQLAEIELELRPDDVEGTPEPGLQPPDGMAPVKVRATLEPFGDPEDAWKGEEQAKLLRIGPVTGHEASADQWLTETCRRLGLNAPPPLPASAFEEAMNAASRVAVRDLDALRARIAGGMNGDILMVKTGLPTESGGTEFVWVRVSEAPAGAFVGTLEVEPEDLPGYVKGQSMRVADEDVFDRAVFSEETGVVEVPLTDLVAQDFGVDLPG